MTSSNRQSRRQDRHPYPSRPEPTQVKGKLSADAASPAPLPQLRARTAATAQAATSLPPPLPPQARSAGAPSASGGIGQPPLPFADFPAARGDAAARPPATSASASGSASAAGAARPTAQPRAAQATTAAPDAAPPSAAVSPVQAALSGGPDMRVASAAMALLKLESEMRKTRSLAELSFFIANEPRAVTRAQQIVVLERKPRGAFVVRAVTAASRIDRASPLILWFEAVAAALEREHGLAKTREFDAAAFATDFDSVRDGYPLRNLLWVPFLALDGRPIGGMLQARATPWTESDQTISEHLAPAFAITWQALAKAASPLSWHGRFNRRTALVTAAVLAALAACPVSMSALAPVEVAARDPFVVTSGVEGVVDKVLVEPNAAVKKGQPLIRLADTVLKNRYEVAEREVVVAQTKYKKSAQLAFVDIRGRHDMALAKAELELKTTERDYARDLLERATIRAERDGVAFFGDKRDLVGRPVAVGEKLMEIADPAASEFHVDLAVADAIVLHDRARIKVLLDSDPLHPIEARLERADYQARTHDGQQLAFRLVGESTTPLARPLQLGVRGTAQVYSDRVPLAYYLLRRPFAAARHWIGI